MSFSSWGPSLEPSRGVEEKLEMSRASEDLPTNENSSAGPRGTGHSRLVLPGGCIRKSSLVLRIYIFQVPAR